jgi:hypothetical protein
MQKESLSDFIRFDLMLNSGHVKGYSLADPELEQNIMDVIAKCQSDEEITRKYGPVSEKNRILFAIGDGTTHWRTAKAIWEKHKSKWGMNHPARYALVEIETCMIRYMEFEPIHRALFHETKSLISLHRRLFPRFDGCHCDEIHGAVVCRYRSFAGWRSSFGVLESEIL